MPVQFAFPMGQWPIWLLAGALFVGCVVVVLWRLEGVRRGRLQQFVEAALEPRLLVGYDARVRKPLFWLVVAGCVMLALAVAQPRWGEAYVEQARASRDVLVLLDTSESMNAANPAPSRLDRARQKIASLLDLMPADRFGLIAFSGGATLSCPPTLDQAYFRSVLASIDTDTLSEEGTDIAQALQEAVRAFRADRDAGEQAVASRVILLLSDGEQVSGDALEAAEEAAEFAQIHVIGIGDPNGAEVRFPTWMLQHMRDGRDPSMREPHLSKLDERMVSQLALKGNGVYVRTTPDNRDVQHLHQELENVATQGMTGQVFVNSVNRYRWPLSVAVFCFAAEGLWIVLMPWLRRWRMRRSEAAEGAA
jgi:Ca-activated chloride channel family protein